MNEFIENLKKGMPCFSGTDEEQEIKKALYIYIELGKRKSFDEKYYFGNSKSKNKIYKLANDSRKNQNLKNRKIICVSLSYMYQSILKEFGIDCIINKQSNDDLHVYPSVIIKSKRLIDADLQLDLENIQTKSRIRNFKCVEDEKKNQEILTKMLIEMRYIDSKKEYKDDFIEKMKSQVSKMDPHQTLDYVLNNEGIYKGNEKMEIVEVIKYYRALLNKVIPNYIDRKIYMFNCFRKKNDDEKDYTVCVFSEEADICPYLFSNKANRFIRVSNSRLKKLQDEGLNFGVWKGEKGANKLKKYIQNMERKDDEINK